MEVSVHPDAEFIELVIALNFWQYLFRKSAINKIVSKIPADKILWEAPHKSQQAYFIKHFGANVNLGNIAPNEVIALETLRLGLRSDTFFQYLDKTMQNARPTPAPEKTVKSASIENKTS